MPVVHLRVTQPIPALGAKVGDDILIDPDSDPPLCVMREFGADRIPDLIDALGSTETALGDLTAALDCLASGAAAG